MSIFDDIERLRRLEEEAQAGPAVMDVPPPPPLPRGILAPEVAQPRPIAPPPSTTTGDDIFDRIEKRGGKAVSGGDIFDRIDDARRRGPEIEADKEKHRAIKARLEAQIPEKPGLLQYGKDAAKIAGNLAMGFAEFVGQGAPGIKGTFDLATGRKTLDQVVQDIENGEWNTYAELRKMTGIGEYVPDTLEGKHTQEFINKVLTAAFKTPGEYWAKKIPEERYILRTAVATALEVGALGLGHLKGIPKKLKAKKERAERKASEAAFRKARLEETEAEYAKTREDPYEPRPDEPYEPLRPEPGAEVPPEPEVVPQEPFAERRAGEGRARAFLGRTERRGVTEGPLIDPAMPLSERLKTVEAGEKITTPVAEEPAPLLPEQRKLLGGKKAKLESVEQATYTKEEIDRIEQSLDDGIAELTKAVSAEGRELGGLDIRKELRKRGYVDVRHKAEIEAILDKAEAKTLLRDPATSTTGKGRDLDKLYESLVQDYPQLASTTKSGPNVILDLLSEQKFKEAEGYGANQIRHALKQIKKGTSLTEGQKTMLNNVLDRITRGYEAEEVALRSAKERRAEEIDDLHREAYEKGYTEGEEIPSGMTPEEWAASRMKEEPTEPAAREPWVIPPEVVKAIVEGKKISPEVVKEYPELQGRAFVEDPSVREAQGRMFTGKEVKPEVPKGPIKGKGAPAEESPLFRAAREKKMREGQETIFEDRPEPGKQKRRAGDQKRRKEDVYEDRPSEPPPPPPEPTEAPHPRGGPPTPKKLPPTAIFRAIAAVMEKFPKVNKRIKSRGRVKHREGEKESVEMDISAELGKDPKRLAETMAHELGHVIDLIPDYAKKGNILGRLASIKNYMKRYIAGWEGGPEPLTGIEMKRLKAEAKKLLKKEAEKIIDKEITAGRVITPEEVLDTFRGLTKGKDVIGSDLYEYIQKLNTAEKKSLAKEAFKGMIPEEVRRMAEEVKKEGRGKPSNQDIINKYRELLMEEIRKRRLLSKDEIMAELKVVSQEMRPFEPSRDPGYTKYRASASELYADAFSMLANNPARLRELAPQFYEGFFNYMENKPAVKRVWDQIQKEITEGTHKDTLEKELDAGFDRGQEAAGNIVAKAKRKLADADAWLQNFVDKDWHIQKGAEKYTGPANMNPLYAIEEARYIGTKHEGLVSDYNIQVFDPLKKAGITSNELGRYLIYRRISKGDRGSNKLDKETRQWVEDHEKKTGVINTRALGPEESTKYMNELEAKHPGIKKIAEDFNQIHQEWVVPELEASRMFTPELIEFIKDNPYYAHFKVVKYMEKEFGGGNGKQIYESTGSFEEIANPVDATMEMQMNLLRAVTMNKAKIATIDTWKKVMPEEIKTPKSSDYTGIKQHRRLKEPRAGSEWGAVTAMRDGKIEHYYINKYVAESFQRNPVEAHIVAQLLGVLAAPFKTVFTGMNPGFWLFNTFFRDLQASVRNLPGASYRKFLPEFTKAFGPAFKSAFGKEMDPTVREMYKQKGGLLSVASFRADLPADVQHARLLKRYRREPGEGQLKKFLHFMENTGMALERVNKVAGHTYLKKHQRGMSAAERAHIVRNYAGSPNFLRLGMAAPIYNNLFIFSNAIIQGYKREFEVAKMRPGEYGYKMMKYHVMPKLLQMAGVMGFLGQDVQSIYSKVGTHDMTNYVPIPLGETEDGKAVILRLPQDETGRLLAGILWKAFEKDGVNLATDLSSFMAGQVPSMSPFWDLMFAVTEYASGRNPYDSYRGRRAVREDVFKAGGMRSHKEFAGWLSNQAGGGIVHKFGSSNPDDIKTELEQILGIPVVSNVLGRFIKVTDQGTSEKIYEEFRKADKQKAQDKLNAQEGIRALLRGQDVTDEQITAMATKGGELNKYIQSTFADKYGDQYTRRIMNPYLSKEKKLIVIRQMLKDRRYQK